MRLIDLPVHPAAELFPMLDEDALTMLENDIKLNGQHQPILTWRGAIVDGRNRYAACILGGVKPKLKEVAFVDDGECVRFIVSTNIHRRHLTDEQRDVIGAKLVTMQGQGGDRSNPQNAGCLGVAQAAALVSSTPARIERARTIVRADPELANKVVSGEISKGKALREIKERAKPKTDPDLAADSVIDATEARHAEGDTARSRAALATLAKLDDTELSFIKPDLLRMLGAA